MQEYNDLIYRRERGGRLKIPAYVVAKLFHFAQTSPKQPESGGVLIGRYIYNCEDVVVDLITEPMPGDKQTRTSFFRAKHRHQRIIDLAWKESGNVSTYLGEWHTHPEDVPTPSSIDISDWKRRLTQDQYFDELFFIIVGRTCLQIWSGKEKLPIAHLNYINQN